MLRRTWRGGSAEEWLSGPGEMVRRRVFPGTRDQAGEARRFVEKLFAGTGREDDAGLITGELVNNALFYTQSGEPGGWLGVEVVLDDLACIAVTDLGGFGRPTVKDAATQTGDLCLGGRGLFIVAELAVSVGIHGSPVFGHTVWADLDLTGKSAEYSPVLLAG